VKTVEKASTRRAEPLKKNVLNLEVSCRPASKLGSRYVVGVGQCRTLKGIIQ